MTTISTSRLAHALTVMAYDAAMSAKLMGHQSKENSFLALRKADHVERAIAFARAADEADGLVSP